MRNTLILAVFLSPLLLTACQAEDRGYTPEQYYAAVAYFNRGAVLSDRHGPVCGGLTEGSWATEERADILTLCDFLFKAKAAEFAGNYERSLAYLDLAIKFVRERERRKKIRGFFTLGLI